MRAPGSGRPWLLVTLALLLSAGLLASSAVAFTRSGGRPAAAPRPSQAAEPVGETSPSPTPAATPAPTPSPTASPSPTAVPTATATRSATARATGRPTGPRAYAFPSPTTAYPPLRVTATLDSTSGLQADGFRLSISGSDGDGQVRLRRVAWGDGSAYAPAPIAVACPVQPSPTADPGPYQPSPGRLALALDHAWRHTGTFPVTVEVDSGGGCGAYPPAVETATVRLQVAIGDGPDVSNGSGRPTVRTVRFSPSGAYDLAMTADPYDTDGFVTRVVVDFGDGTSQVVRDRSRSGCDDGGGAYYPGSQPGERTDDWSHRYAVGGSYTISFTITSTGCGGADAQTFTTKVTARV